MIGNLSRADRKTAVAADRIVFLVDAPFSQREWNRLNLVALERSGLAFEVWDCTVALFGDTRGRPATVRNPVPVHIQRFVDVAGIVKAIGERAERGVIFVSTMGYDGKARSVFRALSRARARYALLAVDTQPYGDTAVRSLGGKARSNGRSWRAVGQTVLARLAARLRGIHPPELIVAGGALSLTSTELRLAGRRTKILWAHAADYDQFLLRSPRLPPPSAATAVFLDQYLEGHPDRLLQGGSFCDPESYYANLRRVFASVETALGVEVRIAAHPEASYVPRDDRFGGREISWGRTLDLVRASQLVLAHDSTAVSYAVLCRRPITFLTDDGLAKNAVRRTAARTMASWLARRVYNVDHEPLPRWKDELRVDLQAYGAYRDAFVKRDGTPERPLWEIVSGHLAGSTPTQSSLMPDSNVCNESPTDHSP